MKDLTTRELLCLLSLLFERISSKDYDRVIDLANDCIHDVEMISFVSILWKVVNALDLRKELPF